jgi:hypothetical protein
LFTDFAACPPLTLHLAEEIDDRGVMPPDYEPKPRALLDRVGNRKVSDEREATFIAQLLPVKVEELVLREARRNRARVEPEEVPNLLAKEGSRVVLEAVDVVEHHVDQDVAILG